MFASVSGDVGFTDGESYAARSAAFIRLNSLTLMRSMVDTPAAQEHVTEQRLFICWGRVRSLMTPVFG